MVGKFEGVADGHVGDGKTTLSVKREELADWLVMQATKEPADWAGQKPAVFTAAKQKAA